MPRAISSTTPPTDTKPYLKLAPGPKTPTKKTKTASTSSPPDTKSRPWTSSEYAQLLEHVIKGGAGNWDAAVEGRNGNQCYQSWKKVVKPCIFQAVEMKGK